MKIPFTFRVVYHSVRVLMRTAVLFFCAWLVFIPASAEERAALGASAGEQYPIGLRPMRSARAIVAIAPDRFYVTAAAIIGPEMTPLILRVAMVQLAAGMGRPATMKTERDTPRGTGSSSNRDIDGPRFIQVD